jgi:hypothetical protein
MANQFQLITKYMKDAVDTVFANESKTRLLENGSKFVDVNFKEAGYVKVFSILMDGLSDYYRVNNGLGSANNGYATYPTNDGYQIGDVAGTWEIFKLEYDRGKQFRVDDMDNEETAGMIIGNLLTEFLRTKVVPEVDATRFSKMVAKASATLGNLTVETISANQIIGKFNSAFEWLTEREVPEEEQVIFVNPSVMTLIRNTNELAKFLTQADYRSADGIDFKIEKYGSRPIIEVPSNRFFTNVKTGQNGYYADATSKVINFIVCSKKAIVPIVKLEKSKIFDPSVVQDYDGYKVNFRLYHDVIIPKNKICGVYASVSNVAGTTKSNLLSVNIVKTTNGYKMTEVYTTPNGLLGTVVRSASAFTVGTAYQTSATVVATPLDTEFAKFGSETAQYYALLDSRGVCIATSGSITLPTA